MTASPASRARELLELEDRIITADERGDPPAALALLLRRAEVIDRERRAVAISAAHRRLHQMAEEAQADPEKLTPDGRSATLRLALAEVAGALAAAHGLPAPSWAIAPAAADRGAAESCLIESAEIARVVIAGISRDDRLALAMAVAAEGGAAAAYESFLRLCDPHFDEQRLEASPQVRHLCDNFRPGELRELVSYLEEHGDATPQAAAQKLQLRQRLPELRKAAKRYKLTDDFSAADRQRVMDLLNRR